MYISFAFICLPLRFFHSTPVYLWITTHTFAAYLRLYPVVFFNSFHSCINFNIGTRPQLNGAALVLPRLIKQLFSLPCVALLSNVVTVYVSALCACLLSL